jgi:hypothetical protein
LDEKVLEDAGANVIANERISSLHSQSGNGEREAFNSSIGQFQTASLTSITSVPELVVADGSFLALNNNPQTWSPDWYKWNTDDEPPPTHSLSVARELQSPSWFAPSEMLTPNIPEHSAVANNANQAFTPQLHSERHLWNLEWPLGSDWAQQISNTNAPAFLPLNQTAAKPDWASSLPSASVNDSEIGTCECATHAAYDHHSPQKTAALSWLKDLAPGKMRNSRRSSTDTEHSFWSRLGELGSKARKKVSRQKPELPENTILSQDAIPLDNVEVQINSAYSPRPDTLYRRNTFESMSSSLTELSGVGIVPRPSIRHWGDTSTISDLSSRSEETYADAIGRNRGQTLDAIHESGMQDNTDAAEYERLMAERRAELAMPAELEGEGHLLRPYADALEAITAGIEEL